MINTFAEFNAFYPLLFIFSIILVFILAWAYKDKLNFKKDIHFKDKDVEITSEAFKRIGEVKSGTPNEIILNLQNAQNNKEIHANDKILLENQENIAYLLEENAKLRANYEILINKFENLKNVIGREI